MFKNMLMRSWLSIKRKLGRTIILTLILFMMANLVLAVITIKTAVSAQMSYAKATLGGTVAIQADMSAIRESQQSEIENGGDRKQLFKEMLRPAVDIETADEIASYSEYVKDYSYEISSSANAGDLETVESNGSIPDRRGFPGSNSADSTTLSADLTISGINAYAYISGVQNESMEIKDGTYFDENSENQVMISYEFAELNGLSVNDSFTIKNIYNEADITLTIIGIYDTSEFNASANTLYMNTETASQFLSEDDYNDGNYDVSNVKYYMLNSDNAEEFVAKIQDDFPDLAENNLTIAVDTTEYDAMSSSIESVGSFATTILVIVIIAAIIIVTLIVTINVKDRRYEMGVLLSLGAHKSNIVGQIITELLIVGTIGFVLASVSGTFLADKMSNAILESQIASSAQQSEKNFGRPGAQVGENRGNSSNSYANPPADMPTEPANGDTKPSQHAANNQSAKVTLDINATPIDFLLLFVTGYLVIILALILPSINVLRYQPKEILAGKE
ncbi:MAG: ABC transporter permease [Candidatus Nanosyncoccaceae bacterium]